MKLSLGIGLTRLRPALGGGGPALTFTRTALTGDSISATAYSAASRFITEYPGRDIALFAEPNRGVGMPDQLDDNSNTLMGKVSQIMAGGRDLAGGQIGANDLNSDNPLATNYLANLKAFRDALRAINPAVKVIWCLPYPFRNAAPQHADYAGYMSRRAAILAQTRDPAVWSQFCDYPCFYGDHPIFNIRPDTVLFGDGDTVHPSPYLQGVVYPSFKAFLNTLYDPSRINSPTIYDTAWPSSETGLAPGTTHTVFWPIAGLGWDGAVCSVSVSGQGNPRLALNAGALGSSLNNVRLYNGDTIPIVMDLSANANTPISIDLTFNGDTKTRTFRTAIPSLYTARFDPARKSAQGLFFDSNRSFSSGAFGDQFPAVGGGDTLVTQPTAYVEFTWNKSANGYANANVGLIGDAFPYNLAQTLTSGQADSFGFNAQGIYRIAGANPVQAPEWNAGVGLRTVGLMLHRASGRAWLRRTDGSFFPDTPTFDVDGTIATGAGIVTGLDPDEIRFAACSFDESKVTVNTGEFAFVLGALPANVEPGWR